ncbi:hypothetical protein [Brevundimonas sp.]|uniref:hypothetical protein n=1 Tax=Brevundimonas sp. TaxID=1871086 RepID=UPI003F721BF1
MTEVGTDPFARPERFVDREFPTERSPFFSSFLEKLVVGIVNAHPETPTETEDERHLRVRRAVTELSGHRSTGATKSYDLPETFNAFLTSKQNGIVALESNAQRPNLSWTLDAEVENRDFKMQVPRDASLTYLADRAAAKRRNPNVFAETIRKRLGQSEYRNYLVDVLDGRVAGEEAEMKADLDAIAEILGRWNIRADIDPIALALASYWTEKAEDQGSGQNPAT